MSGRTKEASMQQEQTRLCPKCGAALPAPVLARALGGAPELVSVCSVCQSQVDVGAAQDEPPVTSAELEEQLLALVQHALVSELPPDAIGVALCGALTRVAERAHPNHRFSVSFLDLGVIEGRGREPFPNLADVLRGRYMRGKPERKNRGS
jgi:hypothetical protein